MVSGSSSVGDLLEQSHFSALIAGVLKACLPLGGREVIDASAFLAAVEVIGQGSKRPTSATAWAAAVGGAGGKFQALRKRASQTAFDFPISPGLLEAFATARSLRARIGGRDRYLGLRHVLAAICMAPSGTTLDAEFRDYLEVGGLRREDLVRALARDVELAPEPQENLALWREHFGTVPAPSNSVSSGSVLSGSLALDVGLAAGPGQTRVDGIPPTADEGLTPLPDERGPEDSHATRRPEAVFALTGADDPLAAHLQDRTGALREAEAFAMLASARDFRPPIAVGVFGAWGSGKSFFLRLIRDAVRRRTAAGDEGGAFHRDVVPVVFNAWHYAETNLWASLVDHIFTELDRWCAPQDVGASNLLDTLVSARSFTLQAAETLVAGRREQHEAAVRLERTTAELVAAEAGAAVQLKALAQQAWTEVWAAATDKDSIDKAAKQLGLSEVIGSATDLETALGDLDREVGRTGFVRGPFWRVLTGGAVVALTVAGTLVLPPLVAFVTEKVLSATSAVAVAVSGVVVPFIAAAAYAANTARSAVVNLQKARPLLEAARERARKATEAALVPEQFNLADKAAAAAEAKAAFDAASERLAVASNAYAKGSGRARLMSFVRDRVDAGEYGRQLSFVATIRRDFEALSSLLAAADATELATTEAAAEHSAAVDALLVRAGGLLNEEEQIRLRESATVQSAQGRSFQRIVLYIDDLDRCPPDKVVEVLQGIHLLLAFPLFVVFVAVDVRWLKKALQLQYEGMIQGQGAEVQASAFDYLEKIFQVPYWVRSLDASAAAHVLMDRMAPSLERSTELSTAQSAPQALPSPRLGGGALGSAPIGAGPLGGAYLNPSLDAEPEPARLEITQAEASYVEALAPGLIVTPRRALRFVNTYALIKASLDPIQRAEVEQRDHRALLTLLAISIAADEHARSLFDALRLEGATLASLLPEEMPQRERLAAAHALRLVSDGHEIAIETLRRYAVLVERFSFLGPSPVE